MFKGLLEFFYSKVLIGLNLDGDICQLNIIRLKHGVIKQNIKTDIKTIDDIFPAEALKLIRYYKKKYPFTYIGIFSKTYNQGAIPTSNPKEFIQYDLNLQGYRAKSFDNTWSAYIKNQDCLQEISQYQELGKIDLVFSPFISLYLQSKKDQGKTSLLILQEKQNINVVISNGERVFFGGFFEIQNEELSLQNYESPHSELSDLHTFEDILGSLNDSFEDLDDIDSLLEEENREEHKRAEQNRLEELKDFMRATITVGILENVVASYYSSKRFQSSFIEQIVILDTYGITPDAIRHIKDSMMIETIIRPFHIPQAITALMIEEIKRNTL